jgi:HSP20 family protein
MLPATRRAMQNPMDLWREFDRMLGRGSTEPGEWEMTAIYPCDIRETDQNLIVEAELPGFTKDQIDVSVEQGILTISAHREAEQESEGEHHLKERTSQRVHRRFTLPTTVDSENVEAHLDQGVLTLTLPKKEAVRPRKIEVK